MPRKYEEIKADLNLKISEPLNKNDDKIYDNIIWTLTKLPDKDIDEVIKEVHFDLMGVYGKYMKFESEFNGDRYYIFINSIGLNDKKDEEIQAVIAHEIAHYILGHHELDFSKLRQEIEDEADELAVSWGFDKKIIKTLKNDFHEDYFFECENCGKNKNFEITYLNRIIGKRTCHNCIKKFIGKGNKKEDVFLPYDLMRFEYNDKKKLADK